MDSSEKINILGISYFAGSERCVLDRISESIERGERLAIIHTHVFHTVLGRRNEEIKHLYDKYDLILPDGYGIYRASRFIHGRTLGFSQIYNGTDFYESLLKEADLRRWKIFFLGDTATVAGSVTERLHIRYPNITVSGAHHGFIDLDDGSIVPLINRSKPDIILIGMGTPKQDYWLWKYHDELDVPVRITVGAGIGFISGKKIRAPQILRSLHLEWAFRLYQEPRRLWRRYIIGIPQFLYFVVLQKVRQI